MRPSNNQSVSKHYLQISRSFSYSYRYTPKILVRTPYYWHKPPTLVISLHSSITIIVSLAPLLHTYYPIETLNLFLFPSKVDDSTWPYNPALFCTLSRPSQSTVAETDSTPSGCGRLQRRERNRPRSTCFQAVLATASIQLAWLATQLVSVLPYVHAGKSQELVSLRNVRSSPESSRRSENLARERVMMTVRSNCRMCRTAPIVSFQLAKLKPPAYRELKVTRFAG